jgi:hypothetical protein
MADSLGVGELADYKAFFRAFIWPIGDTEAARRMHVPFNRPIVYHRRLSFDLWNTRYFGVSADQGGWADQRRSYASFIYGSELIYPPPGTFLGPVGEAACRRWIGDHDFQVFRNGQVSPRAWVVLGARPIPTVQRTSCADRGRGHDEMTYARDWTRVRIASSTPTVRERSGPAASSRSSA